MTTDPGTHEPGPDAAPAATVAELVHRVAGRTPDAVAVHTADASVTYRELISRAASVTAELLDAGVRRGDAVAVRMTPGAAHAATLLGVWGAGAYLVCRPAGDLGERDRAALEALNPSCVLTDGAGDRTNASFVQPRRTNDALVRTTRGERAYVAHTSGSTGAPKAIPMTHGALAQLVTWMAAELRVGPGVRFAQWAAPAYDASLVETFAPLVVGATLCPAPSKHRPNPDKIARWLADERVHVFQTVPSFARAVVKAIRRENLHLNALHAVLLAGEPLPAELATDIRLALPGARLLNLYGPTESILATWHEVDGAVSGRVPIGQAIPGRRVLVLDEHDEPCPPGVTGEIVIGSPYVTPGYLGDADRAPFQPPDGLEHLPGLRWYRTGDRGVRRRDGVLEFGGRADAQVKLAGQRLELTEVESALAADDSVAECAVVAETSADGLVARLHAYVVTSRPEVHAADLRALLRRRFGRTLLPVTFTTVAALPRNVGGKVDRRALSVQLHVQAQHETPVRPAA